jgi:DNA-binding beta-propeller fold protein YncE
MRVGPRAFGAARFGAASAVLGVLVAAAAFGAIEQRAGAGYPAFVTTICGLSAPWLVVPFLAGASRARRGGVRVLGCAVALVAVVGFVISTADPVPTFTSGPSAVFAPELDEWPWLLGAALSGPVYALLGHRWRVTRSWPLALAVTVPVMLEPALRWWMSSSGIMIWRPYAPIAWAEAVAGLALTAAAIAIDPCGALHERSGARLPGGPVRRFVRMAGRVGGIALVAVGVVGYFAPSLAPRFYGAGSSWPEIAFTEDGQALYVINQRQPWQIRELWEDNLPTVVTRVDTASMRVEASVDVAPNVIDEGISQAIVTHNDQTLYVVDDSSLEAISLRTGSRTIIRVPGGAVSMVLSPDGSTLYVSTSHDTIVPVAAANARPGHPIQLPRGQARDATPGFLALGAAGEILYADLQWSKGTSEVDDLVGVNLVTGKAVPFAHRARDGVGMVLAPDGRTLYLITDGDLYDSGPVRPEHDLIAVSTVTGKQVGQSVALSAEPTDLAVTPDGRTVYILSSDTVVRVPLSLATGGPAARPTTVIGWLDNQYEEALDTSPDGRNLYVAGGAGVQIIRLT